MDEVILKKISDIFNKRFVEGQLPLSWKQVCYYSYSQGKDSLVAGNYRPIALTSNLCNVMEKIIIIHLYYVLESIGLLANYQFGFRPGRSSLL